MFNSSRKAGWRGGLALVLLCGGMALPAEAGAAAKPYVETMPKRGFHLIVRPREKTPLAQWEYVQRLDRLGKDRAASRQALALRIFWPNAPEAPAAQLFHARYLERRKRLQAAFDAYQHLAEHYAGRFEFNETIERQMQIAKTLMETKKAKFLFLPGFAAPERAIPLFEKIVASAPEWTGSAEAYYLTGVAHQKIYEYDQAIEAFFTALNRFPDSEFAVRSAYAQAQCHLRMSEDAPNDGRALETARAACTLFLQRYPDSEHRAAIESDLARLRARQADNAYARARYYDRILRKPESALIEYRAFAALFPHAAQTPDVRRRIEELSPSTEK